MHPLSKSNFMIKIACAFMIEKAGTELSHLLLNSNNINLIYFHQMTFSQLTSTCLDLQPIVAHTLPLERKSVPIVEQVCRLLIANLLNYEQ